MSAQTVDEANESDQTSSLEAARVECKVREAGRITQRGDAFLVV